MNTRERITKLANQKILILDGAMGTMIQGYGLQENIFGVNASLIMLSRSKG